MEGTALRREAEADFGQGELAPQPGDGDGHHQMSQAEPDDRSSVRRCRPAGGQDSAINPLTCADRYLGTHAPDVTVTVE
jgi:hypothetical protein